MATYIHIDARGWKDRTGKTQKTVRIFKNGEILETFAVTNGFSAIQEADEHLIAHKFKNLKVSRSYVVVKYMRHLHCIA